MSNPKTLVERLRQRAVPWEASVNNDGSPVQVWRGKGPDDPLLVEAADRIEELERSSEVRYVAIGGDHPRPPWECRRCGKVFESVCVHFCVPLP